MRESVSLDYEILGWSIMMVGTRFYSSYILYMSLLSLHPLSPLCLYLYHLSTLQLSISTIHYNGYTQYNPLICFYYTPTYAYFLITIYKSIIPISFRSIIQLATTKSILLSCTYLVPAYLISISGLQSIIHHIIQVIYLH